MLTHEDDQKIQIKNRAIDLLSRREHGSVELARKLSAKQYDADDIAAVIDELIELNYLSDSRFAAMQVRHGYERGNGPMKIRQKMQQSGLTNPEINMAFDEFDEDFFALARSVYRRKFSEPLPDNRSTETRAAFFKEKSRRMRFLAGRGFSMDQIEHAMSDSDEGHY